VEEIVFHNGFQRLNDLHQYGISVYNQKLNPYSRYDHCLGVYRLLQKENVPYYEQLSGLLHDASHTAFSHFGDFFFKSHHDDAWQDLNHNEYLAKTGLKSVIESHNINIDQIYHKNKAFTALDRPLPDLCADRLDYNLQGAFREQLISHEELLNLYQDVLYSDGYWSFSDQKLAEKLARASIHMMETIWSAPTGYISNLILCKIIEKAVELKALDADLIWLGTDSSLMQILNSLNDPFIDQGLQLIQELPSILKVGNQYKIGYKCRAIDPYIRTEQGLKSLTTLSASYKEDFDQAKAQAHAGFQFSIDADDFEKYKLYLDDLIAFQI
jgi:HD superfamily phosphohydrolase